MIWENEEELLKSMLYWQKRALEAEKHAEEDADEIEDLINIILEERNYAEMLVDFLIKEHEKFHEVQLAMDYYKRLAMKKDRDLFDLYTERLIEDEKRRG
jgi:hypothetical protein